MKIRKAFRYRLNPSEAQAELLSQFTGHCRFVWNKVLSLNLARLKEKLPLIWYHEADYWSKLWKRSEEYGFLKEAPAHCVQQKLKDLDKAFKDAFDKNQPGKRLPKPKKRGQHDSVRFPEPKDIKLDGKRISLPKIGWLRFYKSRDIVGTVKNATVSRHAGHWYISIQTEIDIETPSHPGHTAVGIDIGVSKLFALSDGSIKAPLNSFKKHQKKLALLQRRLSKKENFSSGWHRQKRKIQKLHAKIAHCRKDYLHKSTTAFSKNHAMIVIEDLQISNMSKSAKGNTEQPGRNVKAKSGLNKSILDQGWHEARRQLEYKQKWRGGVVIAVPAKHTSQKCSNCGLVDRDSRRSQSDFCCTNCGFASNADINAAKNILAAGHAVLAGGAEPLGAAMKPEPLTA
jgi:putative transposase